MSDFSYDNFNYESLPFPDSHPDQLASIASLFGINSKAVKQARILELGCASGGNIIPIASHYPDCNIVGIDLSQEQVKQGQQHIKELGLNNITLAAKSIMDINDQDGLFDYIICHGTYSWVPSDVRDKILDICKNNLHKNGIAYVSYNTLPGWNMVNTVRDMMLFHTQQFADQKQKITQARGIIEFISSALEDDKTPHSDFMRNEIKFIKNQPDSYILHEYLAENNHPLYFHQFMALAKDKNLSYLADAQLHNMYSDNFPSKVSQQLANVPDIIATNQYMDFIRNQRFRSTLLCHAEAPIDRNLQAEDIKNYYLSFNGENAAALSSKELAEGIAVNFESKNISLQLKQTISKMALSLLIKQSPGRLHYKDLINEISERLNTEQSLIEKQLNNDINFMRLVLGGMIDINLSPAAFILEVRDQPETTTLVRHQASKQNRVTNQLHQSITVNLFERSMLLQMDGKTHISDMINKILIQSENKQSRPEVESLCQQALIRFSQQALLT
jgi:methyltransferase-like protein/2-polyprenyl-3-methyl-5-hydroxy-6-metoxy-1,4-benzoquinol methylase